MSDGARLAPAETSLAGRELITHARDSNGLIRASETTLSAADGIMTPTELFYILNHYDAPPPIKPDALSIRIGGAVRKPYTLTYEDLRRLPSHSVMALMECAGTSRKFLQPATPGVQLGNGSVSSGEWTGVPLSNVISRAEPIGAGLEILLEGRDRGTAQPENEESSFAKALPWEKVLSPDTIIAWALNGQALSHAHGSPLRLVVPGWYGVWWVKWISRIEVLDEKFQGFWQKRRYVYDYGSKDGRPETLVTLQKVKSVITNPGPDAMITRGPQMIRGYAWSGSSAIARVEVSLDGGRCWRAASMSGPRLPWMWSRWEMEWQSEPGRYEVCSRATDETGQTQPSKPDWNRLGYANNAVQTMTVSVH